MVAAAVCGRSTAAAVHPVRTHVERDELSILGQADDWFGAFSIAGRRRVRNLRQRVYALGFLIAAAVREQTLTVFHDGDDRQPRWLRTRHKRRHKHQRCSPLAAALWLQATGSWSAFAVAAWAGEWLLITKLSVVQDAVRHERTTYVRAANLRANRCFEHREQHMNKLGNRKTYEKRRGMLCVSNSFF